MNLRKLSSLFLIFLILNLNMVVPAVSYATADETCSCHLNSADYQCHCDDGSKSCEIHKNRGQESGVSTLKGIKGQGSENLQPSAFSLQPSVIKGQTCSTSRQNDNTVLPVSAIPFMVPVFCNAVPMVQVSNLSLQSENPLHGILIAPAEKPPSV